MAHHRRELVLIAVLAFLSLGVTACAGGSDAGSGEVEESHEDGEHDEGGEGEESGVYIDREATWDATRRGARLILSFDSGTNAFTGSVRNTTNEILCAVRVEVHLAGGQELGPTPRRDVAAGESMEVSLATEGAGFEQWTAHPEISRCEG